MSNVFEGSKQAELYINIEAGKVYQFEAPSGFNTALIFNPDLSDTIYCDLQPDVSAGRFIASAAPLSWGIVVDPFRRNKLYLYSASAINNIRIKMLTVDDPVILLNSQLQTIASSDVSVVSTVGLKKADIAVDATTKAILTELDPAAHYLNNMVGAGQAVTGVIDYAIARGHLGQLFVASFYQLALGNGASSVLRITTGASDVHIVSSNVQAQQPRVSINVYEGVTITEAGTAMINVSMKRSGTPATPLSVFAAGATYTGGTLIYSQVCGSDGQLDYPGYFIFKANKDYALVLKNEGPNASDISADFVYHE